MKHSASFALKINTEVIKAPKDAYAYRHCQHDSSQNLFIATRLAGALSTLPVSDSESDSARICETHCIC